MDAVYSMIALMAIALVYFVYVDAGAYSLARRLDANLEYFRLPGKKNTFVQRRLADEGRLFLIITLSNNSTAFFTVDEKLKDIRIPLLKAATVRAIVHRHLDTEIQRFTVMHYRLQVSNACNDDLIELQKKALAVTRR